MTKNFPNLFQLVGPNTVLGHNSIIFMIESQVNYILQLIDLVEKSGQHAIELNRKFKIPSMKECKTTSRYCMASWRM
jgi:cation diffusion facilitator CzcD-associated flavoprotein CzcO